MTHVPGWFNACDYLTGYVDAEQMRRFKGLVLDDELRDLAAKIRSRIALIGPHRAIPVYDLTLSCLECGFFYEDSDELRAKLKDELRDIVGKLDDFLAREGTQREREERHAKAIAADRRQIMGVIREHAGNAVSFKLPMRWFDDWTRAQRDGQWETWPALKPESLIKPPPDGGYRWDAPATDPLEDIRRASAMLGDMLEAQMQQTHIVSRGQYENLKRCAEYMKWPEAQSPNRTPAEREAYMRSFQAQWPERYEDDQPFRRAVNDFRKRNAHLYEGSFAQKHAKYSREFLAQHTPDELRALYEKEFGQVPEGDPAYWREGLLTVMPCECAHQNAYDCRATRDGTERRLYRCQCKCHDAPTTNSERDKMVVELRAEWDAGRMRLPTAEEQQPFVEEYVEFSREYFDKMARRREVMCVPNPYTPQETEVLRAWARYFLVTEQFDRSNDHFMDRGEAIPAKPCQAASSHFAGVEHKKARERGDYLVGRKRSLELKEYVARGLKGGKDVVETMERFLAQLPPEPAELPKPWPDWKRAGP